MSEMMKKHLEKRYKEILLFLTEHDADVVRAQVDNAYHGGRKAGQKNQVFLDYLPFSFIIFCVAMSLICIFVAAAIVNASWKDYVTVLESSHQADIERLEHNTALMKDGMNESQQVCIEKLIECELTKTK